MDYFLHFKYLHVTTLFTHFKYLQVSNPNRIKTLSCCVAQEGPGHRSSSDGGDSWTSSSGASSSSSDSNSDQDSSASDSSSDGSSVSTECSTASSSKMIAMKKDGFEKAMQVQDVGGGSWRIQLPKCVGVTAVC